MSSLKFYKLLIIVIFSLVFFTSCYQPIETTTQYYTPCFKEDNSILFIKHQYLYKGHAIPFARSGEYKTYLCEMDINGEDEQFICQLPESDFYYSYFRKNYIHLSYGDQLIGICSPSDDFFIFDDSLQRVYDAYALSAKVSFDGMQLAYTKHQNETLTVSISAIDGTQEVDYCFGWFEHWLPDNNQIVYSDKGNYIILNISTSNTQSIPFNYHWSHDMQKIAYYDTDINRLVIMDSDETNKVTTDWDGDVSCWSYDGQYILSGFNLLDKDGNFIRTLREEN